jgi:hypothetical protein
MRRLRSRNSVRREPRGSVTPAAASKTSEAAEAWAATQNSTSVAVLQTFADRYGDTIYGRMARARIEELKRSGRCRAAGALARADGRGGAPGSSELSLCISPGSRGVAVVAGGKAVVGIGGMRAQA